MFKCSQVVHSHSVNRKMMRKVATFASMLLVLLLPARGPWPVPRPLQYSSAQVDAVRQPVVRFEKEMRKAERA